MTERIEDASRSQVLSWIRAGRVRVNGAVVRKASRKLRAGDVLEVDPAPRPPLAARPEAIDISVLYEDDHLAFIDKAPGMMVHSGAGQRTGTLVNALLHRFASLSQESGATRPGIVHRLDRFTSGAMVVAKTDRAHRHLQEQFRARRVVKHYWAAVEGSLPSDPHDDPRLLRKGRPIMRNKRWWLRLELPIRRDKRNRVKMAVSTVGREAISDMRLLRGNPRFSLVEVCIHTGRTHQVRLHLASVGHPVVCDSLYGARRSLPAVPGLKRFLLHSRRLEFKHPESGERMRFEAPLPPDFSVCLLQLGL